MAMLVIRTQYRENYGTEDQPYWKNKGGSEYKIVNVPTSLDEQELLEVVDRLTSNPFITYFHSWCEQYLLNWSIETDDYMSWFEKSQLEYDGEILFKEPIITYDELINERSLA